MNTENDVSRSSKLQLIQNAGVKSPAGVFNDAAAAHDQMDEWDVGRWAV